MIKTPSIKHTTQIPLRGKIIQIFLGVPDGHIAFTTSLRLDASFTMTSRILHHRLLAAPDATPILRPKPMNLPTSGFDAQTGKSATSYVDACPPSSNCHDTFNIFRALVGKDLST